MRSSSLRFLAISALLGATLFTVACTKKDPAVNLTINGTLENGDLVVEDDGSWYDDTEFYTEAGWTIQVVMQSEAVVPFVWLISAEGESLEQLTTEAGSRAVVMTHVAAYSGNYTVRANSLAGGETGAYQLTITTTAPGQTPPAPPVEGSTIAGPPEGAEAPAAGSAAAPVAPIQAIAPAAEPAAATPANPAAVAGDGAKPGEASAAAGKP
jgi:hypothetical protein